MATRRFLRLFVACSLSVVGMAGAPSVRGAYAADLIATPSVALEAEWNSDVADAQGNTGSDTILRATPKIGVVLNVPGRTLSVSGGMEFERYMEQDEMNGSPATKFVSANGTDSVSFGSRLSVRPAFRYVESEQASRRNLLSRDPLEGLSQSETAEFQNVKSRDVDGSLQATINLSKVFDVGFGAGFTQRDYKDDSPDLTGSTTWSANASATRRFTPIITAGASVSVSETTYDNVALADSPRTRSYTGALDFGYLLTEKYGLDASLGATMLRNEGGGNDNADLWTPFIRLKGTYKNGDFRATILGSYESTGAGSTGSATKRSTIDISLVDQFIDGWWWEFSNSYQTNKSTDAVVSENIVTDDRTAEIRYVPATWATIHLRGSDFRQWSTGRVGDNIARRSVVLGATLSLPVPIR